MYRGRRRVDSHVFLGADRLWGGRGWLGEGGGATYRGRRRIDSHIVLSADRLEGGGVWVWQPFSKRAWERAAEQDLRISNFCAFVRAVRPWPGRRRHVGESAGWGPWQCKHREGHWWGEGASQRLW
jgi:hypothetical protein